MSLQTFFNPKSVAIVGASRQKGKVGYEILANMVAGGYAGKIYPINPKADEIDGLKVYPDLPSIGETPDLVIVIVPAQYVAGVLEECAKVRVKSVIIITAGFKEVGPEGKKLEEEIVQIARRSGIRFVGPNCLGLISPSHKLNASFGGDLPIPGGDRLHLPVRRAAGGDPGHGQRQRHRLQQPGQHRQQGRRRRAGPDRGVRRAAGDQSHCRLPREHQGRQRLRARGRADLREEADPADEVRRHGGRRQGRVLPHGQSGRRRGGLRVRVRAGGRHPLRVDQGAVRLRPGVREPAAAQGAERGGHHQRRRARHHGGRRHRAEGPDLRQARPTRRRRSWPRSCRPRPTCTTRSTCSATPWPTATSSRSTSSWTIRMSMPPSCC